MLRFVSMVNFEGAMLAMTEDGAVWQFHPIATVHAGEPTVYGSQLPAWTKVADGPLYAMGAQGLNPGQRIGQYNEAEHLKALAQLTPDQRACMGAVESAQPRQMALRIFSLEREIENRRLDREDDKRIITNLNADREMDRLIIAKLNEELALAKAAKGTV